MKRIGNRTVELTDAELAATAVFDELLDSGSDVPSAADAVEAAYQGLDPEFYRYLRGWEPWTAGPCTFCGAEAGTACDCGHEADEDWGDE